MAAEQVVRHPEFLIVVDDEFAEVLRFPDIEDANFYAHAEHGSDAYAELVTPEIRRAWRNAARRERYEQQEHPSRRKPASDAAQAWHAGLSMGAALALYDDKGRCRCPQCRRFCTLDDFVGAPTAARGAGICLDFDPVCKRCRS